MAGPMWILCVCIPCVFIIIHSEFLAQLAIVQPDYSRVQDILIDNKTFTSIGGLVFEIFEG